MPSINVHGFSGADLRSEVQRELTLRRKIYPRRVLEGKLEQTESRRRIETLEAVAQRLVFLESGEAERHSKGLREMIAEVRREGALRRSYCLDWARKGRMSHAEADLRINLMAALESLLTRSAHQ